MGQRVVEENWDLNAVVRSCSSAIVSDNPLSFLASLKFEEEEDPFSFHNVFVPERNSSFEELQDAYPNTTSEDAIFSSSSSIIGGMNLNGQEQQEQVKTSIDSPLRPTTSSPDLFVFGEPKSQASSRHVQQQKSQPVQQKEHQHQTQPGTFSLRPMQSQPPRSRKRKSQQKRMVCHVTVENLAGDLWTWRKYGQKPIKGSPYPRNYYRCSSSKGCAARKQVERSNTNPNLFIVTYTGDHTHARPTHRNSLAGTTRSKFPRTQTAQLATTSGNDSCSFALFSMSHPPTAMEEVKNNQYERADVEGQMVEPEAEDDEDDLLIPNLAAAMNEDLFKGLEELSSFVASGGSSNSSCSSNSRGGEVG